MDNALFQELQNRVFSKLIGEGGLDTDFTSLTTQYDYYNLEMKRILARILEDEEFANELTSKIVTKYVEICKRRGIQESKFFDKVMTPYECSMLARYYGKKMLENEHLSKDSRGR